MYSKSIAMQEFLKFKLAPLNSRNKREGKYFYKVKGKYVRLRSKPIKIFIEELPLL